MEEKCLNCGGVLFEKVQLDEKGHMAMDEETELDLEQEGADSFYRCPHCSAKNVFIVRTSPDGPDQFIISRIKK